jgi:hypothetical protein
VLALVLQPHGPGGRREPSPVVMASPILGR